MKRKLSSPDVDIDSIVGRRRDSPFHGKSDEECNNDPSHKIHKEPEASSSQKIQLPVEPGNCTNLLDKLDFTGLDTLDDISTRFDEIGRLLLSDYELVVSSEIGVEDVAYQILELEFYLLQHGIHEDPFTHGTVEQSQSGKWYFHRAPRRGDHGTPTATGGYRGGTRKGMDLTIGGPLVPHLSRPTTTTSRFFKNDTNKSSSSSTSQSSSTTSNIRTTRGGALLRTIRRVSDSKIISGPSLLVDEVLKASSASSIIDLVETKWTGDTSGFLPSQAATTSESITRLMRMFLRPRSVCEHETVIYKSPRIGLDLSHSSILSDIEKALIHPRTIFVSKPYRYFTHPHLLTANGRGQTFLGVYQTLKKAADYCEDSHDIGLCDELVKRTGLKEGTVKKYLADYKTGLAKGNLKRFIGTNGKGASASASSFLELMGALHTIQ
ncbi:hypothetical protein C8Q75DRAFT_886138 [Abortiporus biennis]|nr:hypothetical protein C8Q75DRAFT_886138 [Abortiporus biennis]